MRFFAKNRYDFSLSISAIFSCAGATSQITLICLHLVVRSTSASQDAIRQSRVAGTKVAVGGFQAHGNWNLIKESFELDVLVEIDVEGIAFLEPAV